MTGPLVFLAASALVCTSATLTVSLLGLQAAVDTALAWILVASTVIIATLLVAGAAFQELSPWLVLILNLAVALSILLVWLARGHRPEPLRHARLERLHVLIPELRRDSWLLVLVVVAAAEVVWRGVIAYLMPPYANDALWYHLTTVAGWVHAGRIGPSSLSIWSTVHPQNGELLFTWPALLLGDDTLVDAVQLPFAIVGAVAVAGIGSSVGLSRRGAAAAGCLFLLTPIVLSQTTASYTDVIFIAFFLVALHFVLRLVTASPTENRTASGRSVACLAGLAAGLALGAKELGFAYVGVLSLLLVAHLVAARRGDRLGGAGLAWSLVLFAVPLLALGSYHYVETWVRFGNPVYPVRVAPFGVELFRGRPLDQFLTLPPVDGPWWKQIWTQWHKDHFFLVHPRFHAYSYDGRPSGLGPLWSYLGFPLLIVYALRAARVNRAWLLNLLVPVAVMFAVQPYRWWSRFTMLLVAVAAIAILAVLEAFPPRWPAAPLKLAILGLVALGVAFPTLKIDGEFWATRIVRVATTPAEQRTVGRVALAGYRWVDKTPSEATIGVDLSTDQLGGEPYILPYPLFGRRFEHDVISLPVGSASRLEEAIVRRRISYVFVRRGRMIDRWAQRAVARGCADRIFAGHVYAEPARAYRISPGCLAG